MVKATTRVEQIMTTTHKTQATQSNNSANTHLQQPSLVPSTLLSAAGRRRRAASSLLLTRPPHRLRPLHLQPAQARVAVRRTFPVACGLYISSGGGGCCGGRDGRSRRRCALQDLWPRACCGCGRSLASRSRLNRFAGRANRERRHACTTFRRS